MAERQAGLNPPGTPGAWGEPPLTARPEGLLSTLGIQSGGRYPQHLEANLVPTYELGDWYREYNQTFRTVTVSPGAGLAKGSFVDTTLAVPDGEIWIVNRIGCLITSAFAAASRSTWILVRTNNADGTILPLTDSLTIENQAAPSSGFGLLSGRDLPIILRPTVKLRLGYMDSSVNQVTSANFAFTLSIAFSIGRV